MEDHVFGEMLVWNTTIEGQVFSCLGCVGSKKVGNECTVDHNCALQSAMIDHINFPKCHINFYMKNVLLYELTNSNHS